MKLTKAQFKHLALDLAEHAIERIETIEGGSYTEQQWNDVRDDLIIDFEVLLDRVWPYPESFI
jgi:hypothetical protein